MSNNAKWIKMPGGKSETVPVHKYNSVTRIQVYIIKIYVKYTHDLNEIFTNVINLVIYSATTKIIYL